MPMRKVGSDTPSSDPASSSCDSMLLRLSAYTPSGTPTTSASTAATSDSSSVAGRRD